MPILTRRRFLLGTGAAVALLAADALAIEPRRIVVARHELRSPGSVGAKTLRVAQLTDLHLQRVSSFFRNVAKAVNRLAPDLVLLTGDSIDDGAKVPELKQFLDLLEPRTKKFATLGNWEHWAEVDLDELRAAYSESGCRLLVNETAMMEYDQHEVLITGMDDCTGGQPDLQAALANVAARPNHLLLAHSPVYRDHLFKIEPPPVTPLRISDYSISAVLSGHTHGGQVALLGWAPITPAGSGDYVAGWYRDDKRPPLYVSRGLGTSVAPVRFGAAPEIAVFDWQLASD